MCINLFGMIPPKFIRWSSFLRHFGHAAKRARCLRTAIFVSTVVAPCLSRRQGQTLVDLESFVSPFPTVKFTHVQYLHIKQVFKLLRRWTTTYVINESWLEDRWISTSCHF